jgi:hypothetical protein
MAKLDSIYDKIVPNAWESRIAEFMVAALLVIASFYPGLAFFSPFSSSLANPELSLALKILKDFPAALALAFFSALLFRHRVRLSTRSLLLLSFPLVFAALLFALMVIKQGSDLAFLGVVKNYAIYYILGGAIVLWSIMNQRWHWLAWTIITISIVQVCIAGTLTLLSPYLPISLPYDARLAGLLLNPNYLGFYCASSIALFFALRSERTPEQKAEQKPGRNLNVFGLDGAIIAALLLGLAGSLSLTALGGLMLWPVFLLWIKKTRNSERNMIRIGFYAAAVLTVFMGCVFIAASATDIIFFDKFRNIFLAYHTDEIGFVGPRIRSILETLSNSSDWFTVLFGIQPGQIFGRPPFFENDSAFVNLWYNFGLASLIAWLGFHLMGALQTVQSRAATRRNLLLLGYVMTCLFFQFWLQYYPEKHPTSLIYAIVLYSALFPEQIAPATREQQS